MAIKYDIEKHAYAFPSKCLASYGGAHIFNILASEDVDNGWLVGKGAWQSLDLYAAAAPTSATGNIVGKAANGNYYVEITAATNAYLVYTVPVIDEEFTMNFKNEANFYNKTGDVMRAYELKPGDVVEMNKAALDLSADPSAYPTAVSLTAISGVTTAKQLA